MGMFLLKNTFVWFIGWTILSTCRVTFNIAATLTKILCSSLMHVFA